MAKRNRTTDTEPTPSTNGRAPAPEPQRPQTVALPLPLALTLLKYLRQHEVLDATRQLEVAIRAQLPPEPAPPGA